MAIEPGIHDKLSYQLQMPADIADGKTSLSYQVADGGRLQTYRFNVTGEDRVDNGLYVRDPIRRATDPLGSRDRSATGRLL